LAKQGKLKTLKPVSVFVPNLFSGRDPVSRSDRRFARGILVLAAGFLFSIPDLAAQLPKPEEYHVKAVYLYNFGKFVDWPAAAAQDDVFRICVIGNDPFGQTLDATLAGESIDNRKLIAVRIAFPREAVGCRVLFISASEGLRLKEILKSVDKSAILTVSDLPGFTSNGGMIQFVLQENKVRFEVNLAAAAKSGLTFSSQLLKVATEVKKISRFENGIQ